MLLAKADGSFSEIDTALNRFVDIFGLADLNRDGNLDLFSIVADAVVVWFGDGAGHFPSSTTSPPGFDTLYGP